MNVFGYKMAYDDVWYSHSHPHKHYPHPYRTPPCITVADAATAAATHFVYHLCQRCAMAHHRRQPSRSRRNARHFLSPTSDTSFKIRSLRTSMELGKTIHH
ncbi:hypothetical protein CEXT_413131 [Caerostris extrusa]|uniref:Uncharacterized protein n=1 Tax=Caerostris extrusa TaxID=172846 RepID=A0AAV4SV92_CAEEX|nr:hypothetical protein CEXT_413131 [Caerostris extrusa]